MRIADKATVDSVRKDYCEICGMQGNHVHHVITKGSGGPDIRENLVNLCVSCHAKAHNGKITQKQCFNKISKRERCRVSEIERTAWALKT